MLGLSPRISYAVYLFNFVVAVWNVDCGLSRGTGPLYLQLSTAIVLAWYSIPVLLEGLYRLILCFMILTIGSMERKHAGTRYVNNEWKSLCSSAAL